MISILFDPTESAKSTLVYSTTVDGTVQNTNARAAFPNGIAPIDPNELEAGSTLRIAAWGFYSSAGGCSLDIGIDLGGGVIEYNSSVALAAVVSKIWRLDAEVTIRSAGSGGEYRGASAFTLESAGQFFLARTVASIDTTVKQFVVMRAHWTVKSASNSVTMEGFNVEVRKPR